MRMRPGLENVDPTTSISSLDASAAGTEPEIVSVTIDKVLTLDSTSFKVGVVLSLQSHDGVLRMHPAKAIKRILYIRSRKEEVYN